MRKVLAFSVLAVLLISASLSLLFLPKPLSVTASSPLPNPASDPYTNFTQYDGYTQSFYKPSLGCFTAYPIYDVSGGDYYNCWLDDAGKLTAAFTQLGDTSYADKAASFIMDNSINDNGYVYLPERVINYTAMTYLHVNTSQLASRDFPITYTPVLNPSFETENTSKVNGVPVDQPTSWTPAVSGPGTANDINNANLSSDGSWFVSTNTNGAGTVSYSQYMETANQIVVYAHDSPNIGENGGVVGNYTASYLNSPVSVIDSTATSSNQMSWSYVSYPPFPYDTVFPANSNFQLTTYLKANQSLTGVTYGGQVNEVCNGYTTETSPWGGEVVSTVNVGTSVEALTVDVSTGSSNFVFASGCALHLIIYLNPNTTHAYTFTVYYDAKQYETHTVVPYLPTVSRINNAASSLGFTLKPLSGDSGFFFAVVTSDGSELLTSGSVNSADVPHLISPVTTYSFTPSSSLGSWGSNNFNGATLLSNLNPDGIIQYLEFGADSASANVSAAWDDIYYILNIGQGDSPAPVSGQYMIGGYYYANNGIVGLSNASVFQNTQTYEKAMSVGLITSTENATTFGFLQNPSIAQALGSSPFISDFFVWDSDNNGSGVMSRQILPYSISVGLDPYRLYVSGGNGSAINVDFWIGVSEYRNLYVWINATIAPGQDYIEPSMTMYNLGVVAIQLNDLNFGLGSFDTFMRYVPWWSYLQLSNGTIVQDSHGYNDTSTSNYTSYDVYNSGQSEFSGGSVSALLWTGFRTPEFADGLLVKPLQASSLSEIDYVSNFFGHSLRFVMNENGKVISPGGSSDTFSFQFTPTAKTDWTEPGALLYAFLNRALTTPGVDISMPGTWGFDTYGLTMLGQQTNNATVLNFAKELWNSQYQDVIQRLHPAQSVYNPSQQPVIYYRALYLFGLAGLMLYPNNATVLNLDEQIATYAIADQLNSFGLPFGLEEDGWAVGLLGSLYSVTSNTVYLTDMQDITSQFFTNSTYVSHTASTWPPFPPAYDLSTPTVWNLNQTGGVNAYCNHPNIVFRCGELTNGLMLAEDDTSLSYWNSPAALTSASLIWEASNPQPSGLSVDVRYSSDTSGNSNTETQPVTLLGLIQWMKTMQSATGTFIANLRGAGISSIQYNTIQPTKYDSLVIGLSVPTGKTANITINYAGRGGPPEFVSDNGLLLSNYVLNTTSQDIILNGVASTITLLWPASGAGSGSSGGCASSANPTITSEPTYIQIGGSTNMIVPISNSGNNVSITLGAITYNPPSGIQAATLSQQSQTVDPMSSGSFNIHVSVSNSTALGTYKISATAPFTSPVCSSVSGLISFQITVNVGTTPSSPNPFLQFIESWWWVIVIIVLVAGSFYVVKRRRDS